MSDYEKSRRQFLKDAALLLAVPGLIGAAADIAVLAAKKPSAAGSTWNLEGPTPHLMSHYMPWFAVHKKGSKDDIWQHWSWAGPGPSHDPNDRRPDGLRDIASVYYPLIGPYNTWSPDVIRYHLKTAKAVGIQGFLIDWDSTVSDTDARIPQFLDEAHKLGMKIGLCYEEKLSFAWPKFRDPKTRAEAMDFAKADMQHIAKDYGTHPAFLKRGGIPYVFQFNSGGTGPIGPKRFSPAEWTEILASLPNPIIMGRQGLDETFFPPFDASYQWWSSNAKDLEAYYAKAAQMVGDKKMKFFMSFTSPGFNDSGVSGWSGKARVTPRAGLSLLRDTFDRACATSSEIIQIVTWNDFNEGTVVEPTRENGFQYLDALATWWGDKTGHKANLDAIRAPFLEYCRTCSPAEKAELPTGSLAPYLAHRSLAVEIPHYLDTLG